MKILYSVEKLNIEGTVVALGFFDGIHGGHRQLLNKCLEIAREKKLSSCVFMFSNLPVNFIRGNRDVKLLQSKEDKIAELESMGFDYVFCIPFNEKLMNTEAEDFVRDILAGSLNCKVSVCGFNYSFGKNGAGRPEDLIRFGNKYGFEAEILSEYKLFGKTVSSSYLRSLLEKGSVAEYLKYAEKPFTLNGRVVHGKHKGSGLGFPTANIDLNAEFAAPMNGVYITNTYVNSIKYESITDVGNKPTAGIFDKSAETYIFNFNEDIYDKEITVEFIDFIRPEKKFESMESLKKQIAKDCEFALHYRETVV